MSEPIYAPDDVYKGEAYICIDDGALTLDGQFTFEELNRIIAWAKDQTTPKVEKRYDIVRYYRDDRPSEVQAYDVTLEVAQKHCNDPATRGDGWFDGYRRVH